MSAAHPDKQEIAWILSEVVSPKWFNAQAAEQLLIQWRVLQDGLLKAGINVGLQGAKHIANGLFQVYRMKCVLEIRSELIVALKAIASGVRRRQSAARGRPAKTGELLITIAGRSGAKSLEQLMILPEFSDSIDQFRIGVEAQLQLVHGDFKTDKRGAINNDAVHAVWAAVWSLIEGYSGFDSGLPEAYRDDAMTELQRHFKRCGLLVDVPHHRHILSWFHLAADTYEKHGTFRALIPLVAIEQPDTNSRSEYNSYLFTSKSVHEEHLFEATTLLAKARRSRNNSAKRSTKAKKKVGRV